jgi:hypothetical protein
LNIRSLISSHCTHGVAQGLNKAESEKDSSSPKGIAL